MMARIQALIISEIVAQKLVLPQGSRKTTRQEFWPVRGWKRHFSNIWSSQIFMRKYFEAQVQAYEQGAGWIYWMWKVGGGLSFPMEWIPPNHVLSKKAENADDWSYQTGLKGGWIPQNPSDKIYNNLCGYSGILPNQWDEAQNVLVAPDVN